MILHIPHVLTDSEIKQVRALLDVADFKDGRLSAGQLAQTVKNNQEITAGDQRLAALNQIIMPRLTTHPEYLEAVLPRCIAEPFYVRYEENMGYGEHTDDPIMGKSEPYRSDIAITVFLNQPEEYDGGELLINTLSPVETQAIKYPAGDAVLYSANTIHQVKPVIKGIRLVAITWAQSLIANNEHRELLYQLAKVRNSLMNKVPNTAEAQRVSWVYSNLVRLWSTV